MNPQLVIALKNPIWANHKVGDNYSVTGDKRAWKLTYYPIFEDGKTNEPYTEPRALMETPLNDGIDFREMPLRYVTKLELI